MVTPRLIISSLVLSFCASVVPVTVHAQQELTPEDRDRYVTQVRAYKHRFLVKELDLSKEAQRTFFPLYDQMEDELMQMQLESRALERKVADDEDASATELEAAAASVYGQKEREGKLEMEYFEKFKDILTPRQLLKLKSSEKKFNQSLMKHRKHRPDKND